MPYLARCLIATESDQARALTQSPGPLIIGLENADPGLAGRGKTPFGLGYRASEAPYERRI
jgi:hypothetical protein